MRKLDADSSFLVLASDRRSARRSVRIACEVVRERDFRRIGAKVLDLSMSGLLVETDDKVLTGEPVIVSFRAPKSEVWIDAQGTIARVVHGRRDHDHKRSFGVHLEGVDIKAKLALAASLRRVPPAKPRRAERVDYAATVRRIGKI